MPFTINGTLDADGVLHCALSGELDLVGVPILRNYLDARLALDTVAEVQADLSAVTFMDSSGIGALIACLRRANEHGKTFRIVNARGRVLEVLDLTNVTALLTGGTVGPAN